MTIFPFNYTILLWNIDTWYLMYYSFIDKEISHEKIILIITYYFYYCLKLCLNKNNNFFQNLDNFRFLF